MKNSYGLVILIASGLAAFGLLSLLVDFMIFVHNF
jgi:hypothetical protein